MTTEDSGPPDWLQATVPEHYVDTYSFQASPYTAFLSFGVAVPGAENNREVVRLRMSLEHAKVMSILFRRSVKGIEQGFGIEIPIPNELLKTHNINLGEDWQ